MHSLDSDGPGYFAIGSESILVLEDVLGGSSDSSMIPTLCSESATHDRDNAGLSESLVYHRGYISIHTGICPRRCFWLP